MARRWILVLPTMLYTEPTYQLMHSISIELNFLHRSMVPSTKLPTKVAKRVVLL
jgi:hypothetical protein